jgi:hypothetical protein
MKNPSSLESELSRLSKVNHRNSGIQTPMSEVREHSFDFGHWSLDSGPLD